MNRIYAATLVANAHLIKAFAEGKTIQVRLSDRSDEWRDVTSPTFDSNPVLYRIKPEPRVLFARYKAGVLRDVVDNEIAIDTWVERHGGNKVKFIEVTE